MRTCYICKNQKPVSEFRTRSGKDYPQSYCKPCARRRETDYRVKIKGPTNAKGEVILLKSNGQVCAVIGYARKQEVFSDLKAAFTFASTAWHNGLLRAIDEYGNVILEKPIPQIKIKRREDVRNYQPRKRPVYLVSESNEMVLPMGRIG